MLEALAHTESSFVTLTYAPEHLPEGATLVPRHMQLWLKRLRKAVGTQRLRYFLVGEYGDHSLRPHYHAALFGLGIRQKSILEQSWPMGFVLVGSLTKDSAAYISQYVTKKMTDSEDPRLCGRSPEFARMSLRPGLGLNVVPRVKADVYDRYPFLSEELGDVPTVLMHGVSKMPLGRYLRNKLREAVYGSHSEFKKVQSKLSWTKEMQDVWKVALSEPGNASLSLSRILADRDAQRVLTMEARCAIFRQRRTL